MKKKVARHPRLLNPVAVAITITLFVAFVIPAVAQGSPVQLFNNWNKASVGNGPRAATTFSLKSPATITNITNYHWNNGRGAPAGTISLKGQDGRTYGPWRTRATSGTGGAQNVNWIAEPNVTIPAGNYTVIDSSPSTWSQNSGSGGRGFTQVQGIPQSAAVHTPVTRGSIAQEITGIWTSNYGDVSFTGSNSKLGGSWNQGSGKQGVITGGSYDPRTRKLVFYYRQDWNKKYGRADLNLEGSGASARLNGNWKQWPFGKSESQANESGRWTMSRR